MKKYLLMIAWNKYLCQMKHVPIKNITNETHELGCCSSLHSTKKMKFSIEDFFSKCDQTHSPADLITCSD